MRKLIAALVPIGLLAACGGQSGIEQAATSVPQRDLTLSTAAVPSVDVASGIELVSEPTTRRSRPIRPVEPVKVARETQPETAVAQPTPESQPAAASEPAPLPAPAAPLAEAPQFDAMSRELAPGATITVIPVSTTSSGAGSPGSDWSEAPRARTRGTAIMGGGHAGNCGAGRGRGPVSILK